MVSWACLTHLSRWSHMAECVCVIILYHGNATLQPMLQSQSQCQYLLGHSGSTPHFGMAEACRVVDPWFRSCGHSDMVSEVSGPAQRPSVKHLGLASCSRPDCHRDLAELSHFAIIKLMHLLQELLCCSVKWVLFIYLVSIQTTS